MSPPTALTESDAREFASAVARRAFKELRAKDVEVRAVMLIVDVASGRRLFAAATDDGDRT